MSVADGGDQDGPAGADGCAGPQTFRRMPAWAPSRCVGFETILVMQPSQNWRGDESMSWPNSMTNGPVDNEIRRRLGNARSEAGMRAAAIVVGNPPGQHPAEMPFVERNHEV